MAFLATENKNRHLEDLPQADFGRVPERFLSVRLRICNIDNYAHCLFCGDSTLVLFLSAPRHFPIFIWGLSILLFSFINKVDSSSQKKAIVFM